MKLVTTKQAISAEFSPVDIPAGIPAGIAEFPGKYRNEI